MNKTATNDKKMGILLPFPINLSILINTNVYGHQKIYLTSKNLLPSGMSNTDIDYNKYGTSNTKTDMLLFNPFIHYDQTLINSVDENHLISQFFNKKEFQSLLNLHNIQQKQQKNYKQIEYEKNITDLTKQINDVKMKFYKLKTQIQPQQTVLVENLQKQLRQKSLDDLQKQKLVAELDKQQDKQKLLDETRDYYAMFLNKYQTNIDFFNFLIKLEDLKTSTLKGNIDNNIAITLNTLFKKMSKFYINGEVYTVLNMQWNMGDWSIEPNYYVISPEETQDLYNKYDITSINYSYFKYLNEEYSTDVRKKILLNLLDEFKKQLDSDEPFPNYIKYGLNNKNHIAIENKFDMANVGKLLGNFGQTIKNTISSIPSVISRSVSNIVSKPEVSEDAIENQIAKLEELKYITGNNLREKMQQLNVIYSSVGSIGSVGSTPGKLIDEITAISKTLNMTPDDLKKLDNNVLKSLYMSTELIKNNTEDITLLYLNLDDIDIKIYKQYMRLYEAKYIQFTNNLKILMKNVQGIVTCKMNDTSNKVLAQVYMKLIKKNSNVRNTLAKLSALKTTIEHNTHKLELNIYAYNISFSTILTDLTKNYDILPQYSFKYKSMQDFVIKYELYINYWQDHINALIGQNGVINNLYGILQRPTTATTSYNKLYTFNNTLPTIYYYKMVCEYSQYKWKICNSAFKIISTMYNFLTNNVAGGLITNKRALELNNIFINCINSFYFNAGVKDQENFMNDYIIYLLFTVIHKIIKSHRDFIKKLISLYVETLPKTLRDEYANLSEKDLLEKYRSLVFNMIGKKSSIVIYKDLDDVITKLKIGAKTAISFDNMDYSVVYMLYGFLFDNTDNLIENVILQNYQDNFYNKYIYNVDPNAKAYIMLKYADLIEIRKTDSTYKANGNFNAFINNFNEHIKDKPDEFYSPSLFYNNGAASASSVASALPSASSSTPSAVPSAPPLTTSDIVSPPLTSIMNNNTNGIDTLNIPQVITLNAIDEFMENAAKIYNETDKNIESAKKKLIANDVDNDYFDSDTSDLDKMIDELEKEYKRQSVNQTNKARGLYNVKGDKNYAYIFKILPKDIHQKLLAFYKERYDRSGELYETLMNRLIFMNIFNIYSLFTNKYLQGTEPDYNTLAYKFSINSRILAFVNDTKYMELYVKILTYYIYVYYGILAIREKLSIYGKIKYMSNNLLKIVKSSFNKPHVLNAIKNSVQRGGKGTGNRVSFSDTTDTSEYMDTDDTRFFNSIINLLSIMQTANRTDLSLKPSNTELNDYLQRIFNVNDVPKYKNYLEELFGKNTIKYNKSTASYIIANDLATIQLQLIPSQNNVNVKVSFKNSGSFSLDELYDKLMTNVNENYEKVMNEIQEYNEPVTDANEDEDEDAAESNGIAASKNIDKPMQGFNKYVLPQGGPDTENVINNLKEGNINASRKLEPIQRLDENNMVIPKIIPPENLNLGIKPAAVGATAATPPINVAPSVKPKSILVNPEDKVQKIETLDLKDYDWVDTKTYLKNLLAVNKVGSYLYYDYINYISSLLLCYNVVIYLDLYKGDNLSPEELKNAQCNSNFNNMNKAYSELIGRPYVVKPYIAKRGVTPDATAKNAMENNSQQRSITETIPPENFNDNATVTAAVPTVTAKSPTTSTATLSNKTTPNTPTTKASLTSNTRLSNTIKTPPTPTTPTSAVVKRGGKNKGNKTLKNIANVLQNISTHPFKA